MGSIAPADHAPELVEKLRSSLKDSSVYTPGDEGYAQSIVRWSDAFEKKAVGETSLVFGYNSEILG